MHRETVGSTATVTGGVDRVLDMGTAMRELEAKATAEVARATRADAPADFTPSPEQEEAVRLGAHAALAAGPTEGGPIEDVIGCWASARYRATARSWASVEWSCRR